MLTVNCSFTSQCENVLRSNRISVVLSIHLDFLCDLINLRPNWGKKAS